VASLMPEIETFQGDFVKTWNMHRRFTACRRLVLGMK
jgi:hypothetical protein